MKKSILVAMVAVLMLFAFTACDNQVPNMLPDEISYIEIEQVAPAVEGLAFDSSNFNIVIHSSNPGVADKVVSGRGYVNPTGDVNGTYAPEMTVAATYATVQASALSVNVLEITDVAVTGLPETVVQNSAIVSTDTLAAVVTLSDGSTLELDSDQFTINYSTASVTPTTGVGSEGTAVTVWVNMDRGTSVFTDNDAAKIVVTAKPDEKAPIKKGDVDKLEVLWTITGVDGKTRTSSDAAITVKAGESVSYAISGTKEAGLEDGETALALSKGNDYMLTLDTLSSIVGKTLAKENITGYKASESATAQAAYTATVTFVSDPEDANYGSGSVDSLTLSVTVEDNLVSVPTGGWIYDADSNQEADVLPANTAVTLVAGNITKTVKSIGGVDVKLVGTVIKDKASYAAAEVVANTPIKVEFKWGVDAAQSSTFTVTGTDTISIGVGSAN